MKDEDKGLLRDECKNLGHITYKEGEREMHEALGKSNDEIWFCGTCNYVVRGSVARIDHLEIKIEIKEKGIQEKLGK